MNKKAKGKERKQEERGTGREMRKMRQIGVKNRKGEKKEGKKKEREKEKNCDICHCVLCECVYEMQIKFLKNIFLTLSLCFFISISLVKHC